MGAAVALNAAGTVALLGAPDPVGTGSDANAGQAFLYTGGGATWTLRSTLTPPDGVAGVDQFGQKVALSGNGDVALIGAPQHTVVNPNGQIHQGSAYLFGSASGTWTEPGDNTATEEVSNADDGQTGNNFGFSVGLNGDGTTALVGALGYGTAAGSDVGAAYGFAYAGTGTVPPTSGGSGSSAALPAVRAPAPPRERPPGRPPWSRRCPPRCSHRARPGAHAGACSGGPAGACSGARTGACP